MGLVRSDTDDSTGGSQVGPKAITLNDTPFYITRNLHSALLQLRSVHEPVILWVDAIAINQADIPERNWQVSTMCDIYSGAEKTVIPLDPTGNEAIGIFFDIVKLIDTSSTLISHVLSDDSNLLWLSSVLKDISMLDYWQRVWVIQEVMHSKYLVIIHQRRALPYNTFALVCDLARRVVDSKPSVTGRLWDISLSLEALGPEILPPPGAAFHGRYMTLAGWVDSHQHKESTDLRDIVFGYHGCFSPELRGRIRVDYSTSVEQVWTAMTQLVICEIGLGAITYGLPKDGSTSLPSWVPRWGENAKVELRRYPLIQYNMDCSAGGNKVRSAITDESSLFGRRAGDSLLKLSGIIIGTVEVAVSTTNRFQFDEAFRNPHEFYRDEVDDYFQRVGDELGVHTNTTYSTRQAADFVEAFSLGQLHGDEVSKGGNFRIPSSGNIDSFSFVTWHTRRTMFSYRISWGSDRVGKYSYGLGPDTIASKDRICILFGCPVPVVLREVGQDGHCIFVGDAYVPGCMFGEAVKGVEEGREAPLQFIIE